MKTVLKKELPTGTIDVDLPVRKEVRKIYNTGLILTVTVAKKNMEKDVERKNPKKEKDQ